MTVSDMETRMTSKELTEWQAYFTLEPWGQVQADYRAGVITSWLVNVMTTSKKTFKPKDFFPLYEAGAHHQQQTMEEQIAILKRFERK